MKPAAFEYHDPATIAEATALLAQFGERARPLAGGQSLVPLMNFRLLKPAHLIDLNRVRELDYLRLEDGELRIGAMTRQRRLERSAEVAEGWPLLRDAAGFIGHVQIRNRGTVGGSLAHAFPSAELPVAMMALGASFILRKNRERRAVGAEEFFVSHMTTVLDPDELLAEIRIPGLAPKTAGSFQEVSRRHGDFALAGAAALITLDGGGSIARARLVFTGPVPVRAREAEDFLLGHRPADALFGEAAGLATKDMEQDSDIHASADYRVHACEVLGRRALAQAAKRAAEAAGP
jgi:CO/xanthine dehydrogenase FAD-binding subunit